MALAWTVTTPALVASTARTQRSAFLPALPMVAPLGGGAMGMDANVAATAGLILISDSFLGALAPAHYPD